MTDTRPKLLVVEDDAGLQAQLKWAYEDFEVLIAGDRSSALTLLRGGGFRATGALVAAPA